MADHIGERQGDVCIFASKAELFAFTADRILRLSEAVLTAVGRFVAALSGGQTPTGLYRELARPSRALDWKKIDVFLVDERIVPYEDSRSNFGMIKKTLLDAVPIPAENVHPIPVDQADPYAAARRYEEEIYRVFRAPPGAAPRFDLVLLGIGEDGHTASLFPGSPLLDETTRLAGAVPEDDAGTARITLTLPVINNAQEVIFLVTGKTKAPIVQRVIEEKDGRLPAARVRPRGGRPLFYLDNDAASKLAPPVAS